MSDELSEFKYKNGRSGTIIDEDPNTPVIISDVFNKRLPAIVKAKKSIEIDMKKYPRISNAKKAVLGGA
jgi:hypothetical protein